MRTFGRRVDVPGGRRSAVREAVVLAASAFGFQQSRSVVVPDLSEAGARLQGRELPDAGERLLINFGETGLFATVAWSRRDECGILFDRRIDPGEVRKLQAEADWGTVMGLTASAGF